MVIHQDKLILVKESLIEMILVVDYGIKYRKTDQKNGKQMRQAESLGFGLLLQLIYFQSLKV